MESPFSESEADMNDIDEQEHDDEKEHNAQWNNSAESTLRLMKTFLRRVLKFCLNEEVHTRFQRQTARTEDDLSIFVTAEDDGETRKIVDASQR
jgi:hypothetical protein